VNVVIPMAGLGTRFKDAGFKVPKPLIDVLGKPMYYWAVSSLPLDSCTRLIFIALTEHLDNLGLREDIQRRYSQYDLEIISVAEPTAGQACTVLLAKEFIDNDMPLIIHNVDTYFVSNLARSLKETPFTDGIISVFEDTNPKWSFVRIDESGQVQEVAEKKPISNLATTGMYYFGSGKSYVSAVEEMIKKNIRVNNEFYISSAYNILIQQGAKIGVDYASEVYCFGTPEDFNNSVYRLQLQFRSREKGGQTMEKEHIIVMDIDSCLCEKKEKWKSYSELKPVNAILERLREYKRKGFHIILYTSRNMNTFECNIGKINANTAKIILDWLEKYNIPYDEIYFGKPWCGFKGFYVDDKAIRPSEFLSNDYDEIVTLLNEEKK